jgi:hypothetical protein
VCDVKYRKKAARMMVRSGRNDGGKVREKGSL